MKLHEVYQAVVHDIIHEMIRRYNELSDKRFESNIQQFLGLSNKKVNDQKKKYVNEQLPKKLNEINTQEPHSINDYFDQVTSLLECIDTDISDFYTDESKQLDGLTKELLERSLIRHNDKKEKNKESGTDKKEVEPKKEKTPLLLTSIRTVKANHTDTGKGSNLKQLTKNALDILDILKVQMNQLALHLSRSDSNPALFNTNTSASITIENSLTVTLLSYFFTFLMDNPSVITSHSEDFDRITSIFFNEKHEVKEGVRLPRLAYFAQIDDTNALNTFMQLLNEELSKKSKSIKKTKTEFKQKAKGIIAGARSYFYDKHGQAFDEQPSSGKREALCDGVFSPSCFGSIDFYQAPKQPSKAHIE